jgi:hypothetical protein
MIFGQGKVLFPFLAQRKRRRLHSSGLKTFLKKNITQTLARVLSPASAVLAIS